MNVLLEKSTGASLKHREAKLLQNRSGRPLLLYAFFDARIIIYDIKESIAYNTKHLHTCTKFEKRP